MALEDYSLGNITMQKDDKLITEEDLEKIWNKLTNLITPPDIEKACFNAIETLEKTILKLVNLNIESGFLKEKDAYLLGQNTAEVLSQFSRMSFMIGLEYGSKDKNSIRSDDFVAENAKKALPLIKIASEPLQKAFIDLIGCLLVSKVITYEESQLVSQDSGKIILNSFIQCFRLGLNYSSKI